MAVRELPAYQSKKPNYRYVENVDNFVHNVMNDMPTVIALDTETYYNPNLHPPDSIIKFIKGSKNNAPFGVSMYWGGFGYWIDKDFEKLKPIIETKFITKVLHNAKFDMHMLKNIGIEIKGDIWDTMIMIHLIDEEHMCRLPPDEANFQDVAITHKYKRSKSLKNLAYHFLGEDAHELEDLVKEYRTIIAANRGLSVDEVSYKDVNDENPVLMKDYACADTEFTMKLFNIFLHMLREQDLMRAYEIDINATKASMWIERNGMCMDKELMKEDEKKLESIIEARRRIVFDIVGNSFNVNSDSELVAAFQQIGQQWCWYTDTQDYCTDKNVMKGLCSSTDQRISALAKAVLDYRKANKMLSTYIVGMYPFIQEDGKIHPDFWICPSDFDTGGTKTGRLSSSQVNMQNIPKKPVDLELDDDIS